MVSIAFAFYKDTNNLAGAVKQYRNGKDFSMPEVDVSAELQPLNPAQLAASANVVQTLPGGQTSRDRMQDDIAIDRVRYLGLADQILNLFVEESWDNATWSTTWASGNTTVGQLYDTGWLTLTRRYWRFRAVNTSGTTATTTFAAWEALSGGHTSPKAFYLGVGDSVQVSGQVTTPGAGAAIATTAVLPTGVYELVVSTMFAGGAPVAGTDMLNMQLQYNGAAIPNFGNFATPLTLQAPLQRRIARITGVNPGGAAFRVVAVGAATASVIYVADIIATRVA